MDERERRSGAARTRASWPIEAFFGPALAASGRIGPGERVSLTPSGHDGPMPPADARCLGCGRPATEIEEGLVVRNPRDNKTAVWCAGCHRRATS